MIYCFDIDGVICTDTEGIYALAIAYPRIVAQINKLYEDGHTIYLQTARGFETGYDWSALTIYQLKQWGLKYHKLFFGKPTANIYIDDKGMNSKDWIRSEILNG